jgi:membrane-associated phospholipid phosphatase
MNFKKFFASNMAFFIPVILFLVTGIVFLVMFPKDVIHITQNGWYSPFFDTFFKYATLMGEGIMYGSVAICLVFIKWRYLLGLVITGIITLLLVGVLKQVVYAGEPRPAKYFKDKYELRLVEGVEMNMINSFPSGHTTSAFSCFAFLAFIVVSHWAKILCFIAAALAGYSRIYLSQHFLEDVVAGAALGTMIAILSYIIMIKLRSEKLDSRLILRKR